MTLRYSETMTPQEKQVLTLVQVYRTVTADQIAEALHLTWGEAFDALLRLGMAFSLVRMDPAHNTTQFHIIH